MEEVVTVEKARSIDEIWILTKMKSLIYEDW